MKKINYIVNARIPTEKAHGYQICKMCEEFSRAGAEVELWAPTRNNPIKEDVFSYYGLEGRFAIKYIKCPDLIQWSKWLHRWSTYFQNLIWFLILIFRKISPDAVVYTRYPEIAWAAKLKGKKAVYECHQWFGRDEKLALFLLRKCDLLVTTNSFIKKEFVKRGFNEKKIIVAPNGINLDIFDVNLNKEQALEKLPIAADVKEKMKNNKTLVYTGGFRLMGVDKGIDEILKAMKVAADKNLLFVAVGGTEKDIDYYHRMAGELGVGDKTIFLGRVAQKELAVWQKAADFMLMPFPRKAHYEFFMAPLKMFDYMASERPIIASDLPSIREILNDNSAFFCKPGDADDLARVIGYVLACPEEAKRKAGRARRDAEKYTWAKRADKILNYIER